MSDDLPFTREFLSLMLGVRRTGVTEAAIILQTEELIRYKRGHIKIIDRHGLEDHSCDCYEVIKAEFDLLASRCGKQFPTLSKLYSTNNSFVEYEITI